ncbi:BnaA09g52590D [Brassica napus]|uniref:BnaA09g52590D protein n=1 Tax=Brassica napus TaxID=3708 RepID=A0A078J1L1_BRANA|nr:BnaA09g52590D [Brassica napus]
MPAIIANILGWYGGKNCFLQPQQAYEAQTGVMSQPQQLPGFLQPQQAFETQTSVMSQPQQHWGYTQPQQPHHHSLTTTRTRVFNKQHEQNHQMDAEFESGMNNSSAYGIHDDTCFSAAATTASNAGEADERRGVCIGVHVHLIVSKRMEQRKLPKMSSRTTCNSLASHLPLALLKSISAVPS